MEHAGTFIENEADWAKAIYGKDRAKFLKEVADREHCMCHNFVKFLTFGQ